MSRTDEDKYLDLRKELSEKLIHWELPIVMKDGILNQFDKLYDVFNFDKGPDQPQIIEIANGPQLLWWILFGKILHGPYKNIDEATCIALEFIQGPK